MKYLILLLLFITSCTDKKQTTDTTEPIIAEVIEPEPIVASYDIVPKLFRLADIGENKSIYWNSNSNIYYSSISMTKTNNITYQFNPMKATNYIYYDEKFEYNNEYVYISQPYIYVGSISLLERIYIDTNNPPQQYLKTLEAIDDTFIERYDDQYFKQVPISNTYIFYPSKPTLYTNNKQTSLYWWRGGESNRLTPVD